ncbi:MAG: DegT/DnrJ/EryC1/StrS family aminotransferase, partial [Acidimicrobiales bacterium]
MVNLDWQHRVVADEVSAGWQKVLSQGDFILEFARFSSVAHCVGVANGTDALEIALRALEVGPGDEVIVPANTFIATASAVVRAGADVVLADVDPVTLLVDPAAVGAAVGPRTAALIPVHLYGQMAPMPALEKVASRAGVPMVEDAAQSQGASQAGRASGSIGAAAGTSFYPGKNLGAYGDAGAVLTGDADVARRVRAIRDHGSSRKYEHDERGFNSRLDTLQAVVLRAKLRHLAAWNDHRREAAQRYEALLQAVPGVTTPGVGEGNEHVWHLYVVQVPDRDRVLAELQGKGIGAGIHYPKPVHLHGAFASLGLGRGTFPVAEAAAGRI